MKQEYLYGNIKDAKPGDILERIKTSECPMEDYDQLGYLAILGQDYPNSDGCRPTQDGNFWKLILTKPGSEAKKGDDVICLEDVDATAKKAVVFKDIPKDSDKHYCNFKKGRLWRHEEFLVLQKAPAAKRNLAFYKRSGEPWTQEEFVNCCKHTNSTHECDIGRDVVHNKFMFSDGTSHSHMYPWSRVESRSNFTNCEQIAYEDVFPINLCAKIAFPTPSDPLDISYWQTRFKAGKNVWCKTRGGGISQCKDNSPADWTKPQAFYDHDPRKQPKPATKYVIGDTLHVPFPYANNQVTITSIYNSRYYYEDIDGVIGYNNIKSTDRNSNVYKVVPVPNLCQEVLLPMVDNKVYLTADGTRVVIDHTAINTPSTTLYLVEATGKIKAWLQTHQVTEITQYNLKGQTMEPINPTNITVLMTAKELAKRNKATKAKAELSDLELATKYPVTLTMYDKNGAINRVTTHKSTTKADKARTKYLQDGTNLGSTGIISAKTGKVITTSIPLTEVK